MELIHRYKNGNVEVSLYNDGTKVREYDENPHIEFPESIDVKITNYCDMGCSYCHESSTLKGKHGDLQILLNKLSVLPAGVELAIGGGNPLSHPDLYWFLGELKARGLVANITVNQGHLKTYYNFLEKLLSEGLIYGLGISIVNNNFKYISRLLELTSNIVYHVIIGVSPIEIMDKLIELPNCKVLLLGYKQFGFGVDYYSTEVDKKIGGWFKGLWGYFGRCVISFDNLAIEQLEARRFFTSTEWDEFYMGDDFTYTMYIDAVVGAYAPTSRAFERVSFNDMDLQMYFKTYKYDIT